MPRIIWRDAKGARISADVPLGMNPMKAAVDAGVEAIYGDCGGALACATCHVSAPAPILGYERAAKLARLVLAFDQSLRRRRLKEDSQSPPEPVDQKMNPSRLAGAN